VSNPTLVAALDRIKVLEVERDDWRVKAAHRLNEWRLRADDAVAAEADRDEANSAKDMWRDRALKAEADLEQVISG
jgi:hypothetical protein